MSSMSVPGNQDLLNKARNCLCFKAMLFSLPSMKAPSASMAARSRAEVEVDLGTMFEGLASLCAWSMIVRESVYR